MGKAIWKRLIKDAPELVLVETPCPNCKSSNYKSVAHGIDFEYLSCSNIFSFVKCIDCSLIYLNPKPKLEDFKIIYSEDYYSLTEAKGARRYSLLVQKVWDILERNRLNLLWRLLGKNKKKILDIGCGSGRLLKLLKGYGWREWELVGVEAGLSNNFNIDETKKMTIYKGFFEDVEFKEAPFDLIVAQQVIEHAYNPAFMLEKICKNLIPGGYVIFDTPDFDSIDRMLFSRSYWGGYHFPRHMTLFTSTSFSKFAKSLGFEVVSCTKMLSPVFWVLSLHNALIGNGFPQKWAEKIHYQTLLLICISTLIEITNLCFLNSNSNMRIILKKPFQK